jgi:hypothetical protein
MRRTLPESSPGAAGLAAHRTAMRWLGPVAAAMLLAACGGGAFADTDPLFPMFLVTDVVVADLDGDGRNDVLTIAQYRSDSTRFEGRLTVRRQTSPGSFTAESYVFGTGPSAMIVADVDGDGRTDLLAVGDDNRAWVLLQVPGQPGTFGSPQMLP